MTSNIERQIISQHRLPTPGSRWRSRLLIALTLACCAFWLLAGCSLNANKNIELVKRVEDEELGCLVYISPNALIQREDLAYAASGTHLVVLDVSDPLNPRCVSRNDTNRRVDALVLDGPHAFLAAEGLIVMDISDPPNPQELSRYEIDSMATDIKVEGDYAFLAAVENGLLIFDVSNPEQPHMVSQTTFPDAAVESASVDVTAIDFVDQYAYVLVKGDYPYFIAILDVSDPAAPKVVRRFVPESELNPWDIVVHGQYAYLNGGLQYIDIVDVSDPLAPRLVGSVNTPGHPRQYVVEGDSVYVGDSFNISVIDVANPANPRVAGVFEIGTNNIARVGDYIYSVGQTLENGESQPPKLHIFRFVP